MITYARLLEVLVYDPIAGNLLWKTQLSPKAKIGSVAGYIRKDGRRTIRLDGGNYKAHRLVWMYHTGEMPMLALDHVNGDPLDNRIANLRLATAAQNSANTSAYTTNKVGIKGVSWSAVDKRWYAYIWVDGKNKNLGAFCSIEGAKEAYETAALELRGDFHRRAA